MRQFTLSIPSPCHENWDQMTPVEKGRFCGACQKTVIDFTNMTDQQLAAYFKQSTGSVCGRFVKDQLERNITVPTKRIPWLRYFFQFALPTFLLSLKAAGQKVERVGRVAAINQVGDTSLKKTQQEKMPNCFIKGSVNDNRGNPIPFASVIIKGTSQGTACDADGMFSLSSMGALPFALQISAVGFEVKEHQVTDTSGNEIVLTASQNILGGEVVVVGYPVRSRKAKKTIPLISNKKDTAFNKFSVYPNPARPNGTITIDCKKLAKGTYSMQILAIDGRPVCTKQLELEQKGGSLRTELPALTPAQYVITLLNKDSKKVYTEKIQVL